MNPQKAAATPTTGTDRTGKLFTQEEANRALVLVRRIVTDIVARYGELLDLRSRRHDLAAAPGTDEDMARLTGQIERAIASLNRSHDELVEIGCVLKDWAGGLVDFPSLHQGRQVWLCWRLGEPAVAHWHELHTGFAGRQPIAPDQA